MKSTVLIAALLTLTACQSSKEPAAAPQASTTPDTATTSAYSMKLKNIEDPDKLLETLETEVTSGQWRKPLILDRLDELVKPKIEKAASSEELEKLKKYAVEGSSTSLALITKQGELKKKKSKNS